MLAILGLLCLAIGLASPTSARAESFTAGSICAALAPGEVQVSELERDPARWDCSGKHWDIDGSQASFVRIDATGRTIAGDDMLSTRLTRHRAMWLTAIGEDGSTVTRQITDADLSFSSTTWAMRMSLPRLAQGVAPRAYVLKVIGPRHRGILSDVRITQPPEARAIGPDELLLAALLGMTFMPLILNIAIFRVLRRSFALWHALGVFSMLSQTVIASAPVDQMVKLSLNQMCAISSTGWWLTIICASRFFADLIEPGMLGETQQKLLRLSIPWVTFWSLYYNFAGGPLLSTAAMAYYVSFTPFIVLLGWTMVTAARRGSRSVWFQIVGWTPLLTMGTFRIASMMGATDAPLGLMTFQNFAMGFEVLVTTLGAADRFMVIKDQRDHAVTQARILEGLAERDPLTGLYNRRGFEERHERLMRDGFQAMAVLDIDHFKRINDTRGHDTGDAVLRAVALALLPDEDTVVVRLGGEEFLLLLRGRQAAERAERRRLAITTRVASEVAQLDWPVTASMGLVTGTGQTGFSELYRTCDQLLYEAKSAGRNRTRQEDLALPAQTSLNLERSIKRGVVSLH